MQLYINKISHKLYFFIAAKSRYLKDYNIKCVLNDLCTRTHMYTQEKICNT